MTFALTGTALKAVKLVPVFPVFVGVLLPVPVFFDPETKKILESTLPKDLREEFKDELL